MQLSWNLVGVYIVWYKSDLLGTIYVFTISNSGL